MTTATKRALHRGFTLIELMIVIVILGILIATVLPRLIGGSEGADDPGRKSDLNEIAKVLDRYKGDFGYYPGEVGKAVCLQFPEVSLFDESFKTYFSEKTLPKPTSNKEVVKLGGVSCMGAYLYLPLKENKADTKPTHFALMANAEMAANGNAIVDNGIQYDPALPEGIFLSYRETSTLSEVKATLQLVTTPLLDQVDRNDLTGQSSVFVLAQ